MTYKHFNGMKTDACKCKIFIATWKSWWISLKCTSSESFPLHDTLHLVTDTWINIKVNLLRDCLLCIVEIAWVGSWKLKVLVMVVRTHTSNCCEQTVRSLQHTQIQVRLVLASIILLVLINYVHLLALSLALHYLCTYMDMRLHWKTH